MTKEEKLLEFKEEVSLYMPMMNQAVQTVLDQDVSDYPIFVFHQQEEVTIGINVVDLKKVKGNWSVNVSTLEEFVSKNLILEENVDKFKIKYESADELFCLFVLTELGADFIFLPRK